MTKTPPYLLTLLVLAANSPAFCEEAPLEEMKQRCQQAREIKIAHLREAAIEECVSSRRSNRTHEDCERIDKDFGEGGGTVTGGFRPGLFNDLPECILTEIFPLTISPRPASLPLRTSGVERTSAVQHRRDFH